MFINKDYIQASADGLPNVEKLLKKVIGKSIDQIESPENITRRIQFVQHQSDLGQSIEPMQSFVERITGQNDLLPFSYFQEGYLCGQAVCRVNIRDANKKPQGFGTGFLVSNRLMITNHHVLPTKDMTKESLAEFNYQTDTEGLQESIRLFELLPDECFFSDPALDFTIVAVAPRSQSGDLLDNFGYLRLNDQLGKVIVGEYLSIIQHPEGKPKQIAIRENQLIERKENADTLWYSTDTTPGSSGAPVFNDQWEVVALHHMGVPARHPDHPEAFLGLNGAAIFANDQGKVNTDLIKWLANEGIRVSRIVRKLRENSLSQNLITAMLGQGNERPKPKNIQETTLTKPTETIETIPQNENSMNNTSQSIQLNIPLQITVSLGQISQNISINAGVNAPQTHVNNINSIPENFEEKIEIDPDYANRQGFDENFLGTKVSLPLLNKNQTHDAAVLIGTEKEIELKYIHYSLIMNKLRRLPYFTAVNFDGPSYNKIKQGIPTRKAIGNDRWFMDKRIEASAQIWAKFYAGNDFDLGHLVRREDPVWGDDVAQAIKANNDTYHLTNASPQHGDFNRGKSLWQGLENYILDNARKKNIKINIFAGPVMQATDKVFVGTDVQIPEEFWKIVVFGDTQEKLKASGYIVSQKNLIEDITEADFSFGQYQTFQVPIALIEQKTELKFNLNHADVTNKSLAGVLNESTSQVNIQKINSIEDLNLF